MTMYPWLKRHKRYLSFRYLFPAIAAAWITFRRGLLRVEWFFTHPIDEFLEDVKELLLWPFAALHLAGRWVVLAIIEFLKDFVYGIEVALGWLGRMQVWTGSALAGIMGIILTVLLFLPAAIPTEPIPASIGAERSSQASGSPQLLTAETFDPFASPADSTGAELLPSDFTETRSEPVLTATVTRLSLPLGWNARRKAQFESLATAATQEPSWFALDAIAINDGWQHRRADRIVPAVADFSPYVSQVGARSTRLTPSWIAPEPSVDPLSRIFSQRQPNLTVEKIGPESAPAGRRFAYTLVLTNLGDEAVESVQVRESVTALERVLRVEPAANVAGDELVWDIVDLHPGEQRHLRVELLPDAPIVLAQNTIVEVTAGVAAVSEVRHPRPEPPTAEAEPQTAPDSPRMILPDFGPEPSEPPAQLPEPAREVSPELFPWSFDPIRPQSQEESPLDGDVTDSPDVVSENSAPSPAPAPLSQDDVLSLAMTTPVAVRAGSSVRTIFELTNNAKQDLSDVVLTVKLSDGLQHRHGRSLELRLAQLKAGETYRTRLTTQAVRHGVAQISSELNSPYASTASAQRELTIESTVRPAEIVYGIPHRCPPVPCLRNQVF